MLLLSQKDGESMKIAYLGKIFTESLDSSWYVGKIMTYQAGISHRAANIGNNQIPSDDTYYPIEWSDSATIQREVVIHTSDGDVAYFQSKEHPIIWIRFDDKMSISEG